MPQKVLRFTGINRKANEFQGSGACEELINLRPTQAGMEIVKPKKIKFHDLKYDVYNHSFANNELFVGIWCEHDELEIYIIDSKNQVGNATLVDSYLVGGTDYDIAFIGNQMLITNGTDLRVYAYSNNRYERVDAALPDDIDITYTVGSGYGGGADVSLDNSDPKGKTFKDATIENWSAAKGMSSKKNEIFGPVMVAFNFSLTDGTEMWTNKWMYINPFTSIPVGENGKHMIYYEDGSTKHFTFNSYALEFTVAKKQLLTSGVKNLVKSMNVYASIPIFPYDIDTMTAKTGNVHDREIYAQTMSMKKSEITNQLMYFQKSIPANDIQNGNVTFQLDFSESQAGERILNVDSGTVRRAGDMAAYNNRVHFYDSYVTILPQSVLCYSDVRRDTTEREAYVHIDCGDRTVVMKTKALVPALLTDNAKIACCYPDARARKIVIATDEGYCTVSLEQSPRYNFAWGETRYINSYSSDDLKITDSTIRESDTVSVSEQYNPFVCPVENSYKFGGRVLDIATSYLPISATQIGQYPLTVFTTSGIYAMEQGSGHVLYGNILPLQPHVIDGKAEATPYGTFFVSSRDLYLLSGREAVCVSDVLHGERELALRESYSYKALCCNESGGFCDFSSALSAEDEPFDAIISGARLTYDQHNNELLISSDYNGLGYSYVFNLNTKAYHKVPKKYMSNQNGSRYVIETDGDRRNVIDLHDERESSQPVLLQSKPLSLEEAYTHLQRLMLFADATLAGNQYLFLSVFGSDNLTDWKCIISAQKANTALRQIRTNKAPRSQKDYVIIITGNVDTRTDISDIIADYTVVNRRLG
jgi:hypothetical protein